MQNKNNSEAAQRKVEINVRVRADVMVEENEALNPSTGLTWVQETA